MTANTTLPLETVSESGKAPERRIKSATDAQQVVQNLIQAGRERARFNAKVKGMLDGNPPYDPVLLRSKAQSYRANVNFMEGESQLSAALVPYYDLFAGSQFFAEVRLLQDNPDEAEAKSQIATEEFDRMLRGYSAFEFHMHGILHDYVAFGKGFAMFPSKWGWHFQRVSFNRVFVPDGTEASVDKLELLVIRERMQLHTLWKFIRNRDTATDAGWNPEAVAKAMRDAVPEDRESRNDSTLAYEYVQQRMRDRDVVEGTRQATVPVAHVFVKEFDGHVTHYMVEEQLGAGNKTSSNSAPPPEYLFEKPKKFEDMRQALSAFFFETLDGSWNGARGMGHKIFSSIEIKNRLLCKIVDNSFLSGGITLQAKDATSLQKTSLVQAGDFNIIPPNYDVQNAQIFSNSTGLIGTNQLLDQTIASNTGIFRAKMEKPQGNPRTAKEVEIQYQNATVLSNSGTSRFYNQLDPHYAEIFRRAVHGDFIGSDKSDEANAVRDFRKRCQKRGVTLEDLKKVESVRAYRNIGNGSHIQRRQSLEQFQPFVVMLPESGRQAWMEDLVAAQFGPGKIARYVPPRDKQLLPNDQQAMALLENAAMKGGAPVTWTPTQNNVIHATEHLKAMAGAVESLQQGAQPIEVLAFLEAVGSHTQIHISKLEEDPSRATEFKLLSDQFKQFAQFTDELSAQLQQQQEEQQAAQQEQQLAQAKADAIANGQDPETAVMLAKAKLDMEIKAQKAQQALQIKDATARQKLAASDVKLAQTVKHDAMKANAAANQPKPTTDKK